MCDVNPEYISYEIYENGKYILYVNILISIHGLFESALLWYKLYSETFEGMEFVINPYN